MSQSHLVRDINIFNSAKDLRVIVRTPTERLFDAHAQSIEGSDGLRSFAIEHDAPAMITALMPGEIVLRKRDGRRLVLQIGWGSLIAVNNEVRITAGRACFSRLPSSSSVPMLALHERSNAA